MKNGGPAFPVVVNDPSSLKGVAVTEGMSLRDWFAGQAIAGLAGHDMDARGIALVAYQIADAAVGRRDE